jgi:hypothetical protein
MSMAENFKLTHYQYFWDTSPAESHLTRPLFGAVVQRIDALPARAG